MGKYRFVLLGIILAGLILVGVLLSRKIANKFDPTPDYAQSDLSPEVVSWDHQTGQLVIAAADSQPKTLHLTPLNPLLMIRTNLPGEPLRDEIVAGPHSSYWRLAFCPRDQLAIDYADDGHIRLIQNLGPRLCQNKN